LELVAEGGGNDEGEEGRSRGRWGGAGAGEDGSAPEARAADLGRGRWRRVGRAREMGKKERKGVGDAVKWDPPISRGFLQKKHTAGNWSTRRRIFFDQGAFLEKITQFGPVNTSHVSEYRDVLYPSDINEYYNIFR
jgi:hypothetical protein